MSKQLSLISTSSRVRPHTWRLDERTRRIGRKGLAEARAALTTARRQAQAAGPTPSARGGAPPGARHRPAA